jgi:hypothetical protein
MSVLKIKDENGNWIGITSIKGDKGDKGDVVSPEEIGAATAEDMEQAKADIGALYNDASVIYQHTANKDNPHGVTPAQIGAVSKSGDTVGSLTVDGALTVMRSDSNRKARTVAHNNADKEVDFQNYGDDSNYVSLRVATETKGLGDAAKITQMKDGQFSSFTLLHTGNKEKIFTYGTEDIEAGTPSPYPNGTLHFVHE